MSQLFNQTLNLSAENDCRTKRWDLRINVILIQQFTIANHAEVTYYNLIA